MFVRVYVCFIYRWEGRAEWEWETREEHWSHVVRQFDVPTWIWDTDNVLTTISQLVSVSLYIAINSKISPIYACIL